MYKSKFISPQVMQYAMDTSLRINPFQQQLFERTQQAEDSRMLGSLDMVQLFSLILKSIRAKRCIEVGTYTGYTTLSIAQVLPEDGEVITCDVEHDQVAFDIWKQAEVEHKIKFKLGPAIQTLDELIQSGETEKFDFAFIDADKQNNREYYERCLKLVRLGGIICIDNVIWSGRVADETVTDPATTSIRELNRFLKDDPRVDISLLTIGDGVFFCAKN